MASKNRKKLVHKPADKVSKDRIVTQRKAQIAAMHVQEAEQEARGLYRAVRRMSVTCTNCRFASEHDMTSRVPIAECPNCHKKLALTMPGQPQVVTR